MKFDLGWGNSVAVRQAFLNTYHGNPLQFNKDELNLFDYPPHEGDHELIDITKQVIKRQTGQDYKHVFLTNGANGAVTIALRAYQQMGYELCFTRKPPNYILYPGMIAAAGLAPINGIYHPNTTVCLLDYPSNPLGLQDTIADRNIPVILDGVYLNNVYRSIYWAPPRHDVMIGSYSKLTGLNGIRLGWLATNDTLYAERVSSLITSEYCGLGTANTILLKHVLHGFDWYHFEKAATLKLDINREEWSQLEKFFSGTQVHDVGMFYYAPMDDKAQELFKRANIGWTKGSVMGTDDGFARFNLGQDNEVIADAVAAVLKEDKIK